MSNILHVEFVKDFDNSYYANVTYNGEMIKDLPEIVDYKTLKKAIEKSTNIKIPLLKYLKFIKLGRKQYAYYIVNN